MVGYKIAFHEEHMEGTDVLKGLHYEYTVTKIPVLIVLDIPDHAKTSTPENRYTEENIDNMRDKWSQLGNHKIMPPYAESALRDSAAYFKYKDEDPLTIYNAWFNEYCPGFTEYVHSVKCRCSEAKVIDIVGIFNGMHYAYATSSFASDFMYRLHETVYCPDFNTYSPMAVCAPGIHYFEYPAFAMLYLLEGGDFTVAAREGKIDSRLYTTYLTEELNTLKKEDEAIEWRYCKADAAVTERWFKESCRNSGYGLSIPNGKDETNEE